MVLSYQLTDEEKIREQEIAARRGRLYEARKWQFEKLREAEDQIRICRSGVSSIEYELTQLQNEYEKLHRY